MLNNQAPEVLLAALVSAMGSQPEFITKIEPETKDCYGFFVHTAHGQNQRYLFHGAGSSISFISKA